MTIDVTDLKLFPMFEGYSEEELSKNVYPHLVERKFTAGEVICHERAPGDCCYFLVEGRVEVRTNLASGKNETIGRIEAGSIFGQIVLLDGGTRSATCIAETPATLLELHRDAYIDLRTTHSRLAFDLAREVAANLARQVRQATDSLSAMSESRVDDPAAISNRLRSFVRGRSETGTFVKLRDIKL